jgi:hypothetical protein
MPTPLDRPSLRAIVRGAAKDEGLGLDDLTVMSTGRDPFRMDTPAHHRDGKWLADAIASDLTFPAALHARGTHYRLVGRGLKRPDGTVYANTDDCWLWLLHQAIKYGRWLGYVPWEQVTDERNAEPVVLIRDRREPIAMLRPSALELVLPEDMRPEPALDGLIGEQPYRLAIIGEKSSLAAELVPVSDRLRTDLYLPTGDMSDTMIHRLVAAAADDGRPLVVAYVADCDPQGWNMPIAVARKIDALVEGFFPGLDVRLHRVALTPEQVRAPGPERAEALPDTPLKEPPASAKAPEDRTEQEAKTIANFQRKRDAWVAAMGVQQTEVDAAMALAPGMIARLVTNVLSAYYDSGLDQRVTEVEADWHQEAVAAIEEADDEALAEQRDAWAGEIESLAWQVDFLRDQMAMESEHIDLPAPPPQPQGVVDRAAWPEALFDNADEFAERTRRLIADRRYEGDDE